MDKLILAVIALTALACKTLCEPSLREYDDLPLKEQWLQRVEQCQEGRRPFEPELV